MIDAREYLSYFKIAEARIELKLRQIQSLQNRLFSISAISSNEPVKQTRNVAVMADTVALIIDMQKEIDLQTSVILEKKHEAYLLLDKIKPENAAILMDRFLEGKTVMSISQRMQVTKRQTQRKLKDAIEEFQIVLNTK